MLLALFLRLTTLRKQTLKAELARAIGDRETSEIYRDRERMARELTASLGLDRLQ